MRADQRWATGPATLLINWLYYPPVGHAVEALRLAVAFRAANPALHIAVLLNARTATELVGCVPEIDELYTLDLGLPDAPAPVPSLGHIPRDWDYVFTDGRADRATGWPALDACRARLREWLRPRDARGDGLPARIDDLPHVAVRLQLPEQARAFARQFWGGAGRPRLSLLLASASTSGPSLMFWAAFLERIFDIHPGAEVAVLGSTDRRRSWTRGYGREEVAQLQGRFPALRDAFDVGLLNQLAIAERCAAHISQHTGMSFAVQCVGTPWLVIAGGPWPEYLLNGAPHRSIYPECELYPCFGQMLGECRARGRAHRPILCLDEAALMPKLPALLDGLETLLRGKLSAEDAAAQHCTELRRRRPACVDPVRDSVWDWPALVTPVSRTARGG